MCPIHDDRSGSVSERLFNAAPKMHHQRAGTIRATRDSRRSVWQPLWSMNDGGQGHLSRVLLADRSGRLCRVREGCSKCQECGPLYHSKPEELHNMTSPWPFAIRGMDIIDPFSSDKGQTKHLLVVVGYFTEWIEPEPLASISAKTVQSFVWKNIVCWFGVSHTIISDNGRQFID